MIIIRGRNPRGGDGDGQEDEGDEIKKENSS